MRGNRGGITPGNLERVLLDRPYRAWLEGSPQEVPTFLAYQKIYRDYGNQVDAEQRGFLSALSDLASADLRWGGETIAPDKAAYKGKVILLIDGNYASACEDFVMPFKESGRGQLLGEATTGSSGQPFLYSFGNGTAFRVGAKVEYFPDGTRFEGVGVKPDVEIIPTAEDIRTQRDPVLQKAIEIAQR